nr:hypothetical protein CFP56_77371 [Quercus suber]
MDSMRHLSTSLPARRTEQSQELLTAFKAAALSVTNLYKTSASAQNSARLGGYQDALDDLLAFLDREHLGLGDGEGWRVRQWATERLDDGISRQPASDDDEDEHTKEELASGTRSSSPETSRKPAVPSSEMSEEPAAERRHVSEPPQRPQVTTKEQPLTPLVEAVPSIQVPPTQDFTFRSTQSYPTNHDRDVSNSMEVDHSAPHSTSSDNTIRVIPRTARQRHNRARGGGGGDNTRLPTLNFNLGTGAGNKRKMPYGEFFDISDLQDGRHGGHDRKDVNGRGGKRGRHV